MPTQPYPERTAHRRNPANGTNAQQDALGTGLWHAARWDALGTGLWHAARWDALGTGLWHAARWDALGTGLWHAARWDALGTGLWHAARWDALGTSLRHAVGLCGGLSGVSGLSGRFWGGPRPAFRLHGSRRRRGAVGGSRLCRRPPERGRRRRSGHEGIRGVPADGRRPPVFRRAPAPAGLAAAERRAPGIPVRRRRLPWACVACGPCRTSIGPDSSCRRRFAAGLRCLRSMPDVDRPGFVLPSAFCCGGGPRLPGSGHGGDAGGCGPAAGKPACGLSRPECERGVGAGVRVGGPGAARGCWAGFCWSCDSFRFVISPVL